MHQWANLFNLVPTDSPALSEWERRDPGKGRSHASWTIENIREGSSLITKFVGLNFVEFKALHCDSHYPWCWTVAFSLQFQIIFIWTLISRLRKSVLRKLTMVVMLLPSYPLDIWKVSHISSSSFVVSQQKQLWMSSSTSSSCSNCCFFFECAQSNWCKKHKNVSRQRYSIHVAFSK